MKKAIALAFALSAALAAPAEDVPFMLSLLTPVQTAPDTASVSGFRLNILYGRNEGMYGFDLGIANHTRGDFEGFGIGIANVVTEDVYGCQLADACNIVVGSAEGFQFAAFNGVFHDFDGCQIGYGNYGNTVDGCQIGFVNIATKEACGFQLGLVNVAGSMQDGGLQIGLLNFVNDSALPFFPFFNGHF